jgi:RNA polymerase sigma-70 factor (ECF subfamily)
MRSISCDLSGKRKPRYAASSGQAQAAENRLTEEGNVSSPVEVAALLGALGEGDPDAMQKLVPLVYEELRQLARHYLRGERAGHTLQPTALVHEVYARMIGEQNIRWQGKQHFFAMAATTMRRVLLDHARKRHAAKRGGDDVRITLDPSLAAGDRRDVDVIALDRALVKLSQLDAAQGRIVELRYFAGLGLEEVAQTLSVSTATVKREWTVARAWLHREMTRQ